MGHPKSLKASQLSFMDEGSTTRDDYEGALRAYQQYIEEVKSDQMEEATVFANCYKYLEDCERLVQCT